MKRWVMLSAMLLGFGLVSSVVSADEPKEVPFPKQDMTKIAEMFKKLDLNGDGKLSLEEFSKMELPQGGLGVGGDKGKFGKLDPEQLKKLKEKFGDKFGKIDPEKLKMLKEKFGDKFGKIDPDKLKDQKNEDK